MAYSLRLVEDRLAPGESRALPALHRIVYVLAGALERRGAAPVAAGAAVHDAGALDARAPDGARVLRFELVAHPPPPSGGGTVILEHPIAVDPRQPWLMRCDRVDFEPGGVALPHRHRGGGIRRLLDGALEVTVGGGAPRLIRPGDAWFESGREPVLAVSDRERPTSFVRVAVLPAEIRGQSSIQYVNPQDGAKSRPRTYTVFVDQPIDLVRRRGN